MANNKIQFLAIVMERYLHLYVEFNEYLRIILPEKIKTILPELFDTFNKTKVKLTTTLTSSAYVFNPTVHQ